MNCRLASGLFRVSVLGCLQAAAFALSVLPANAQQGTHAAPPPPASPATPQPPDGASANNPWDQNDLIYGKGSEQISSKTGKDGSCFLPPLSGLAPASVAVSDLRIPAKAKRDHDDGCLDLGIGKIVEAENHFRKAVNRWPKYSAAWIVLGQMLEAQQKSKAATDACSKPLTAEPNYLPSYLCLADISARAQNWDEVLSLSIRALAIDSTAVAVAYDYNAAANLHLHNLSEAETSALRAAEIDKGNTDPRVHFLLAQIYEAKGDRTREAGQLHEYLKYASDPNDISMVKRYLAEIDKGKQ